MYYFNFSYSCVSISIYGDLQLAQMPLAQIPLAQIISNLEHATCPNNGHMYVTSCWAILKTQLAQITTCPNISVIVAALVASSRALLRQSWLVTWCNWYIHPLLNINTKALISDAWHTDMVYCTEFIVHGPLHMVRCTWFIVHGPLYMVNCTWFIVHNSFYMFHCT